MTFAQRLKALRTQADMTQEQLAEAIYVTRAAISKWETGRGYPGVDSLKLIAQTFGVSIDELISEDDVQAKRMLDAKKSKALYCAAVAMLLGAFVFAALVYALGQPLWYIGAAVCVLGYMAFAFSAKDEYARIAGRAGYDLKRRLARIFAIVLIIAIIVFSSLELAGVI